MREPTFPWSIVMETTTAKSEIRMPTGVIALSPGSIW